MNELIKWKRPYDNIDPAKIDEYFENGENVDISLSDLLLNNDSTAIFHVSPDRVYHLGDPESPIATYLKYLLLGVNYNNGHSEGKYKIIVQNIPELKGPWVLFRPPNSNENTFHLQDMIFPETTKPKFEGDVGNPLKILSFYLFRGDPLKVFKDFEEAGFEFVDVPMTEEHLDHLQHMVYNTSAPGGI